MGIQQSAFYYDEVFSRPYYAVEAEKLTPWLPIWELGAKKIAEAKHKKIIDLGCGPGFFAKILSKRTEHSFDYIGYDFSRVAINRARKQSDPRFRFELSDLQTNSFEKDMDVCVSLEFLEHIEFDLDIISKIPVKTRFLFSVPSFDDPGHVRWFVNLNTVIERYRNLLEFNSITEENQRFFVDSIRN